MPQHEADLRFPERGTDADSRLDAAVVDARTPAQSGTGGVRKGEQRHEGQQCSKRGPPGRGSVHMAAEGSGHSSQDGAGNRFVTRSGRM